MVVLNWGTWTPLPNGHVQVRGFTWSVRLNVLEVPEWSSIDTLVTNGEWDENGLGPMWGTWHRAFDNGLGFCDGNYSGKQTQDGYTAHGASTRCEGLIKKQWTDVVNGLHHTRTMLDQ